MTVYANKRFLASLAAVGMMMIMIAPQVTIAETTVDCLVLGKSLGIPADLLDCVPFDSPVKCQSDYIRDSLQSLSSNSSSSSDSFSFDSFYNCSGTSGVVFGECCVNGTVTDAVVFCPGAGDLSGSFSCVTSSDSCETPYTDVALDPSNLTFSCFGQGDEGGCCDLRSNLPGCVQGWGKWRSDSGPRSSSMCIDPLVCGFPAGALFQREPRRGDAFYVLVHQYLGAVFASTSGCGCANPNATDVALIDEVGNFLQENCPETIASGVVAIGSQHPARYHAIQMAEQLDLYLSGQRSVPSCECQTSEVGDDNGNNDQLVLDALYQSASYTPGPFDGWYVEDQTSGVPTNQLSVAGIVLVSALSAVAILLLVMVGLLVYRRVARGRRHRYNIVGTTE